MENTITILGAGYVGLTTAALLAHCGYTVYAVEPDAERLETIRAGKSFFYEGGLDEIINLALKTGNFIPTDSYKDSVSKSSIVFSCVGTPDNSDGSLNLEYVFAAARETAEYAQEGLVYVQKSTVPVGTGTKVQALFAENNKGLQYVSNPEFLREGTAIYDTLYPDRIIAGGDSSRAIDTVFGVYATLERSRDRIARTINIPSTPRGDHYITTSLNSAELIKVTANAFLALKISFANSIAMLADKAGADVVEVMDAVGADARIGGAFLSAGRGYGGGCFPKDVSGLIASGLEHGVSLDIMKAAESQNQQMPGYAVEKLQASLGGQLAGKKIAVLGLAFKAGTSDVRKSPGVAIANILLEAGATVVTYDPQAHEEAAPDLLDGILQVDTIEEATTDTDAVVIATEWSEILNYPAEQFAGHLKGKLLLDAVNQYDMRNAQQAGLTYIGIGR